MKSEIKDIITKTVVLQRMITLNIEAANSIEITDETHEMLFEAFISSNNTEKLLNKILEVIDENSGS